MKKSKYYYANNPKIRSERTLFDYLLEIIMITSMVVSATYIFYIYKDLPDQVPTHFGFNGEVSDYGSKNSLWVLQVTMVVSYLFLTVINRFPHIFNYPVKITEENAKSQYKIATRFIRLLNTEITLMFVGLSMSIVFCTNRMSQNYVSIVIYVSSILIVGTLVRYILKSFREK